MFPMITRKTVTQGSHLATRIIDHYSKFQFWRESWPWRSWRENWVSYAVRKTGSSLPSLFSAKFPGQHGLVVDRKSSIWRERKLFEIFLISSPRKVSLPANYNANWFLRYLSHIQADVWRQLLENCFIFVGFRSLFIGVMYILAEISGLEIY